MSHLEVLESELLNFQIDLPASQKQALARYCDELARWNRRINLTGLSGSEMVRRLVVEPLWIGLQLEPHGILADIGSGNGSPAIPLHVLCKFGTAHLIEARAKRAAFLRHVTTTLALTHVVIHRATFETIISEVKPVDWVTLQGVALTPQLIDSIKKIASTTTTIVWIGAPVGKNPLKPTRTFPVPFTGTNVLLFRLT